MMVHLLLRNNSGIKSAYRRANLLALAERICLGENVREDVELSVLFCDDAFIADLNGRYRGKPEPTDVLSFGQTPDASRVGERRVLGDIAISLETVTARCAENKSDLRDETRLLFCHGLLHLLGCHHGNAKDRRAMAEKQARHLGIDTDAAWPRIALRPPGIRTPRCGTQHGRHGGTSTRG